MLWILSALLLSARAEYRAFELVITNTATGTERVVIATLDPKQFRAYYPVALEEQVTYRATWKCKGNTAQKPVCAKPDTATSPKTAPVPTPSLDQKSKS